jgi:hypothetical protein
MAKESFQKIWESFTEHKVSERDIETRVIRQRVNNEYVDINLYYYKWSKCWREVVARYPNSTYQFERFEVDGKHYDCMHYPDQSASVHCTVDIEGHRRSMFLPVMDFKNNAIKNPNAREISDSKMRCLVKTVSLFGLGLDLYEGEYEPDPPESNIIDLEQERETEKRNKIDNLKNNLFSEAQKEIKIESDTKRFFLKNEENFTNLKDLSKDDWSELCGKIKSHKQKLNEKEKI